MKVFNTAVLIAAMIAITGCSGPFRDKTVYATDTYQAMFAHSNDVPVAMT